MLLKALSRSSGQLYATHYLSPGPNSNTSSNFQLDASPSIHPPTTAKTSSLTLHAPAHRVKSKSLTKTLKAFGSWSMLTLPTPVTGIQDEGIFFSPCLVFFMLLLLCTGSFQPHTVHAELIPTSTAGIFKKTTSGYNGLGGDEGILKRYVCPLVWLADS